ncbi:hypothetical protein CHF27_012735 [Romboutsia maritimum]|uniref:Probable membrane transporter protein n=1 Tax=Romboutsia maritimum TaxID=2020948 RepID=A0A371IQ01_9FIRM|nr:TSUP family transporter [Romboutsia maritimum]RDY22559.1 hypothetical protein CHF27_012735 [Romboutsia maritimum]
MLIFIFLCLGGFLAAFVDSIAGGGGLISMPVLMIAGLPAHLALGTNKFGGAAGCLSSAYRYIKSGKTNNEILKKLVPFTIIGSIIGVKCVLSISEQVLNILVFVMILAVAIYTYTSKSLGCENTFEKITNKNLKLGIIMAFLLGFYDGFFGPGTGTFLTFALIKIYGFDFLHASANTKILNLASNFTALILFILNGQIDYKIAVFYAVAMILGGYFGAKVAIKKGSTLIKPIFLIMAFGVAIKLVYQSII